MNASLSCHPDGATGALRPLWQAADETAARLTARFDGEYRLRHFEHHQPVSLQRGVTPRLRRPYTVPVAYTDWGHPAAETVVCCGGVANSAMRFAFLASELARRRRVVCMDWLGRGLSGWLADETEYTRATYVAQLHQLVMHLGGRPVALVGSSMGGSVALEFIARWPQLVSRLVLNDVGPFIPKARRQRRAQALARFYVFRSPQDILRRVGAAHKHDGPMSDSVRLFLAYHQTRWSPENAGRVYRTDPRALSAYRTEAGTSVDQWALWPQVRCPVMLVHGMASDALSASTIARMQRARPLTVAHVPLTGHAPVLADRHQTRQVCDWLTAPAPEATEFSIPLAPPRPPWHEPLHPALDLLTA